MKEQEFIFTIFTPTYNRAHLIGRAFQSLMNQASRNFEWLVVDSGFDGSDKLVEQWAKEADFPVSYTWQPKNGKHIAINTGVNMARGVFFVILDSDDWLAPNALERLLYHWDAISELTRDRYSGVAGLFAYASGEIVGTPFPAPIIDSNAVEIRTIHNVAGDKFGMIRTDVLRRFPFPEDLGSFVTESLIWNRIAKAYNERYINEVLAYKEYQTNGLSSNSIKIRARSSLAARTYYRELVELEGLQVQLDHRLKACANYIRFSIHGSVPLGKQYAEIDRKAYWILSLPVGIAMYLRDKWLLDKRTDKGVKL